MNKVILVGNLAADPEIKTTQSGVNCASFRVAVQRRFANSQGVREADFISCAAWRQTADFVGRYFHKGSKIGIIGTLQTRSYQAQDGTKRYATDVVVDEVEFVQSKQDGGGQTTTASGQPATVGGQQVPMGGFIEVEDDELPF